jgi:hypothetical protein
MSEISVKEESAARRGLRYRRASSRLKERRLMTLAIFRRALGQADAGKFPRPRQAAADWD